MLERNGVILDVKFPLNIGQKYYPIHFAYVLNIFKYLKWNISFKDYSDRGNAFIIEINGKEFLMDFGDSSTTIAETTLSIFKFHSLQKDLNRVIPFAPVSFYDWARYYELEKQIEYNASGFISNRQRPYAGALQRRTAIQGLLYNKFKHEVAFDLRGQEDYWKEINNVKVAVFVPGQNNNIYDRGHIQYMAFGCATISPNLPEVLPFNNTIIPDIHYIRCNDDYSDLIEIIENLDIEKLKFIGNNAKQLFKQSCTPEVLGKWITNYV